MDVRRSPWMALSLLASIASTGAGPIVEVRSVRPDLEAEAVLALFRGSRASSPAAALSAWKRASAEPKRLGKPTEALLAAINPRMAAELRGLDGARVAFTVTPDLGWWARLPDEDGVFRSLATAAVLSGGAAEGPIDGRPVDRLAGPGSTLMARLDREVILAANRAGLRSAIDAPPPTARPEVASGWIVRVEPESAGGLTSIAGRRLDEWLRATGCREAGAVATLRGSTFLTTSEGHFATLPGRARPVDPAWLDRVPKARAMAAFAVGIDPSAEAWDAAFALLDRVDRADPARAGLAPIRLRLALASGAFGLRPEVDLLPHLVGLSGWVGGDGQAVDSALLALHLDTEAAAGRLLDRIGPKVGVGPVAGRPIRLVRRGSDLLIGWGEGTLDASIEAEAHPDRSDGPTIRSGWTGPPPHRAGAAWPARFPGLVPAGSPLAGALAEAPPVRWVGRRERDRVTDRVWWDGLDATVRRFLDRIPLDPPPDH